MPSRIIRKLVFSHALYAFTARCSNLVHKVVLFCRAAIAFSVLLSLCAPAMACALPGAHLTASEHECCQRMQGQCGAMHMPASHSCCHKSIGPVHVDFAPAQIVPSHAAPNVSVAPLPNAAPVTSMDAFMPAAEPDDSPPPFGFSFSILRI